MNSNLFEVLVDRNIINADTEIEANTRRHDLSGTAYLNFACTFNYIAHSSEDDGSGSVVCADIRDGAVSTISMADITTIDGMSPLRLASIYALNEEGLPVRQGARRGRKPKNRVAA